MQPNKRFNPTPVRVWFFSFPNCFGYFQINNYGEIKKI